MSFANGGSIDLTASGAIKSGKIAAYTELRDNTLVEAQNQLDQFAASMSSALSDTTTPSTVTSPTVNTQSATADVSGMKSGNIMHLTYTDAANVQHQVSIVRVDDPSVLPLSNSLTADPNDEVYGIDFSGSPSSVVDQINKALNGKLTVSGTSLSAL
ncbi:MAG: Flagellar hook-associated protein, partial [Tardiphaga sp.]|nr:Flagellar hook-associated protein [Tardiphaga sp.]